MTKGNFAVVPKDLLIRKDQLSEAHEGMEPGEEQSTEKKVIMRRVRTNPTDDKQKIGMRKRCLALDRRSESSQTTSHSP